MNKVRFGRALGYGARHAAKSLYAAAQAAAAPGEAPPTRHPGATTPARPPVPPERSVPTDVGAHRSRSSSATQQVLRGAAQVRSAQKQAGRQARQSFFGSLAKFSSVVGLQVTGTFFALIALIMAQAAWRSRNLLHGIGAATGAGRFYILAVVALLFAYFSVSNFLRARRRDRR